MAGPLVLVIDDDARLRELYRVNLEMRGLTVAEAANGEEGLDAARSDRPALIVLDLAMPGTDGFAVLDTLKTDASLSDIPVVVLTGTTDEQVEEDARKAGAVAFVAKPVDTDDFVRVVLRYAEG
jgi:CheY-like chemotaxis protein